VLESFEMAGRNDYINEVRDIHNNSEGVVRAHHLTNGVLVRFSNNDELWYEPTAMTVVKASGPAVKQEKRWFVGDRVKWSKATDEVDNIGTIRYHKDGDLYKVTILIGNKYLLVDTTDLEKRVFYYDWPNDGVNPSLSLEPFPIGKKINLKKDKEEVMRGFDMAGRDDYESKMEPYFGQPGTIIRHHKTNGLQVQFDDGQKYWFEPACLDPTPTNINFSKDNKRMVVDSKVKIIEPKVKYTGYVGHVCLNLEGNENIRLSIGDDFVEYPENYLEFASSFF